MDALILFAIWACLIFLMMRLGRGLHVMGHGHGHGQANGEAGNAGSRSFRWRPHARPGTPLPGRPVARIPIVALGMGLGAFLALTFALCVLFDLWFPAQAMNPVWAPLLPGFIWISWGSFFLGLIEAFSYGWYIALVFGPLYNFFAAKSRDGR